MRQVTIELDEHVARWARTRAAEQGVPVNQMLGEMLRWKMLDEEGFEPSEPPMPDARSDRDRETGNVITLRRYARG
jgi:hypothetical protein